MKLRMTDYTEYRDTHEANSVLSVAFFILFSIGLATLVSRCDSVSPAARPEPEPAAPKGGDDE